MDTINQYIHSLTDFHKIILFAILFISYLKWRGGAFFLLTSDGRRLLNIEKELKERFLFKRNPSLWNLLDKTSNNIVLSGRFKGKEVSVILVNSQFLKDPVSALKADISSHLRGTGVIVKSSTKELDFTSESMSSKDVTDLLEKLCS
jgi:hypothetical protein